MNRRPPGMRHRAAGPRGSIVHTRRGVEMDAGTVYPEARRKSPETAEMKRLADRAGLTPFARETLRVERPDERDSWSRVVYVRNTSDGRRMFARWCRENGVVPEHTGPRDPHGPDRSRQPCYAGGYSARHEPGREPQPGEGEPDKAGYVVRYRFVVMEVVAMPGLLAELLSQPFVAEWHYVIDAAVPRSAAGSGEMGERVRRAVSAARREAGYAAADEHRRREGTGYGVDGRPDGGRVEYRPAGDGL